MSKRPKLIFRQREKKVMNKISNQETILYLRKKNHFGTHIVSSTAQNENKDSYPLRALNC